uniref:Cyclin N-terminal domain-containing protein n=1 Tax=Sus scrofa TaxID=9823 RepID=A0A287AWD5_PIG
MSFPVRSLALLSGLRIRRCCELGVGRRRSSDLALPWLRCRLVATASDSTLAWEPPCAEGCALEKAKKKKKDILSMIKQHIHIHALHAMSSAVCEVYKLHRETFYLAQDFFDRYMATQQNVVKTLLQLIGISSLFIAAKLEEIYPPKLHQFAYVTDGACSGDEILTMELIIMKALKWHLSPLTIVSWLNVYMQVAYLNDFYEVLLPQYPQQIFIQIAELLDLCVLDVGCLEFPYGVLAASALYHFSSSELMQKVSGYQWCDIEKCVKWMVPFAMVIRETGSSKLKHFRGVPAEDAHNIQTHINSLDLLDKAQAKKAILSEENRISPLPTGVLTPPPSSKKQSSGQGTA